MKRSRWIPIFAALITGASATGQVPADINLFGDDFPPPEARVRVAGRVRAVSSQQPAPATDYPQILLFHNGRELRGELVEITKDEIVWRRKDASEPLRFPRADVRRVLLVPPEELNNPPGTNAGSLATVKLPGGDWLRGALTSADGGTFTLVMKDGPPIQIPRAHIEWLSFASKPAPVAGLGVGPLALESWLSGGTPRMESKDGTLTVHDAQWIGRTLASPNRFEVAFEVPAESEEGLRFWLQPFGPQPNSYSSGTVQFRFGRKSLKWLVFHDSTEAKNLPLPAEAQAETGPVRYRVLYDGLAQHVVLLRNGRLLGDWSLKPKIEQPGNERQDRLPRGLCLDNEERGEKSLPLQFRSLSVLPWDGVLPAANGAGADQDRLCPATPPSLTGHLDAVREKELVFAGQTIPFATEMFVKLAQAPAPPAASDALLSFGEQGEVSLTGLLVSEGKASGRSVFAPSLELPATALKFIAFAPQKTATLGTGDLLVFKNGNELPGALVTAATGAPLRWRLATGQEIEFQTDRIAGVRLTSAAQMKPAATIELRTGERLRGAMAAFDDHQLRWSHALLGEMAVDRAQLWRLYPNAGQSVKDGSQDPENWLRDTPKAKRFIFYSRMRQRSNSWLALDGRFILRAQDGGSGEQTLGPFCDLGGGLDRFELRVDIITPGPNQGTLNVNFMANGDDGIGMNLSSYELNVYVQNSKAPNGGGNRELPLQDKIGQNLRQLSLRAFVNGPAGTIDFLINGHFIGRTGQATADRLPGVGKSVAIDTYTYGRSPMLLSQVTITPWSGELPRPGESAPVTILANGDVVAGAPISLAEGRWQLESEIGPLDLPVGKVQAVEFGGEMQPASAAGRLRFVDGSALLVDHFRWAGGELSAHHAIFGDLKVPASAVSELIYSPPPVHAATVEGPKKTAQKNDPPRQIFLK